MPTEAPKINNGNGWLEYKREVLLRLDQVEIQLDDIERLVNKVDRDLIKLTAARGSSRMVHSLLVPAMVAGIVGWLARFL
jgi:hypothetical protein